MTGRGRSAPAPEQGDEGGFTLVELLVAMALMLLVSGVAFSGLNSVVVSGRQVEDRTFTVTDGRQAIELIIRDARAANPIDPVATVADYDDTIAFSVFCTNGGVGTCGSDNLERISYQVRNNALERVVGAVGGVGGVTTMRLGPDGPDGVPIPLQRGAIVNTAAQPVFTYFDGEGNPLPTQGPSAVAATTIQNCARSVGFHLVVRAASGQERATVDLETTVDLRNYHEVTECL